MVGYDEKKENRLREPGTRQGTKLVDEVRVLPRDRVPNKGLLR